MFKIGDREISESNPPYVIAELSANHNGSLERAKQSIRAAKESGADAIKLQTYPADTLTIASDLPPFRIGRGTLWEGKNLHALYREAATPWEWQPRLKEEGERLGVATGLPIFSSDAISSSAYASEEILLVLATGGASVLAFGPLVALSIAGLLALITLSYRQVCAGFPTGGGAYAVARSTLGTGPALIAAASLIDRKSTRLNSSHRT
mgnify:CR=1 FL=1